MAWVTGVGVTLSNAADRAQLHCTGVLIAGVMLLRNHCGKMLEAENCQDFDTEVKTGHGCPAGNAAWEENWD